MVVEDLEKRLGKLIPFEEVEKELKNEMSQSEMEEAIDRLIKAGDLFRPRRGYIQRM
jgi:DNA replicative helicase MCM subunit Mcm2 (Cdc46/Mcm family)